LKQALEEQAINRALVHLREALEILDGADIGAEFGARLDHLISLLQDQLEPKPDNLPG
jgi:hypothetical protein